jgi:hypothetical protein
MGEAAANPPRPIIQNPKEIIMKTNSSYLNRTRLLLVMAISIMAPVSGIAEIADNLDDFSHETLTSLNTTRMVINDAELGGKSTAELTTSGGILRVEGKIVPGRGMPGFVSMVLVLSENGEPQDLGAYDGLRLRVRVSQGSLQVLAASSEIQNFDYHATAISRSKEFREIKIPFADLKRVWSEQTPLDLSTIVSINLVASGMQPGSFTYEVDEVGFY